MEGALKAKAQRAEGLKFEKMEEDAAQLKIDLTNKYPEYRKVLNPRANPTPQTRILNENHT